MHDRQRCSLAAAGLVFTRKRDTLEADQVFGQKIVSKML